MSIAAVVTRILRSPSRFSVLGSLPVTDCSFYTVTTCERCYAPWYKSGIHIYLFVYLFNYAAMRRGRRTQEALFQWALKTLMHTLCIYVPPQPLHFGNPCTVYLFVCALPGSARFHRRMHIPSQGYCLVMRQLDWSIQLPQLDMHVQMLLLILNEAMQGHTSLAQ